jgi:hypothetical protein
MEWDFLSIASRIKGGVSPCTPPILADLNAIYLVCQTRHTHAVRVTLAAKSASFAALVSPLSR